MKKGIIVTFLFLFALNLFAQDNIQWRGTDRTGIYKESGLLKVWPDAGPTLLWHYDGLGEGHSSVAIDSDKIYLTGMTDKKGYIYVFDMNGKLLNKKEYGDEWASSYNGPRGTLTVNEGKIYLVSGIGEIYCFDQNTLNTLWKKNLLKEYNASNIEWGINEAPLIIDEKVIATPGGKQHNMVALNKNTGALIWSSPGEGDLSAYCSPLYITDQQVPIIVTMTADHIIGIDASNGKKLWSHENKNRYSVHANTPVYGDNMILLTSGYGRGSTMLRLTNGGRSIEEAWFSKELDNRIGAMVKVGDYAYGSGDSNRYWFCVDWKTGDIKWKEKGLAMGNIIANDGMLYCYTDRGNMVLAKATPEKFDIVSRFSITLGTEQHWAHPVLYKGTMYVRHGNTLMAYKVK
ncbi:outer membrane protein assembly factor BamB [Parabacteroides sp. PF5-5]|uniref:outer membrane protein assembly factor BamB family protein n=1 Tax=unclassified Parabacteroides TaxID=2649774 RepID=UPI0024764AF0|nr:MULTISPECIES: PQQ-binding-like beta-propeller repeat protein [unclassified Parabacteroides]MDH6303738.1 outer membrane protein assembly factor BamB [Parabacteroides sp. PH5-39]MDH6314355.1 outer membrane protein assembly factor BamB [Parabacteroides sp. PF5-13]MDH6318580.1 outer membrane protein assembly factor BamB [Parabacteroides sp. PH5-13]MDH6322127.1 outer membrane protein assembly factor BamB [Parabacteroides sp. PH5-8]MDH6325793.1 outer membrane protein assembly factor BamB [Parabac